MSEIEKTADQLFREDIGDQLFDIANQLSGDETGHLSAIIHCVISELWQGADAFQMIDEARAKIALIRLLQF